MKATPATTEQQEHTTHDLQQPKKDRKRAWCIVRIVDYRLQALAPADPDDPQGDQDWADIGGDTTATLDREAAFQLARQHQGLLMSCNGLPGGGRMSAFQGRVKTMCEA